MKLITLASCISSACASLTAPYLRDLMTEATARSFEKDPTTGKFSCEPGYTGSDCTQKKCPYSMSFATTRTASKADWLYAPSAALFTETESYGDDGNIKTGTYQVTKDTTFSNQHVYTERGGRGLCDRSTGQCKCFGSFTGEGCRRTTCPNDCSGHGQCRTDANSFYYIGQTPVAAWGDEIPDYSKTSGSPTWGIHTSWLKYQQCHCDAGYEGDDCSLRMCPKGDDPETECANDLGNDKQRITCAFAANPAGGTLTKAFLHMRFKDQFNGVYDTRPILLDVANLDDDENANSVQDALEALPNFAIPEIEVDFEIKDAGKTVVDITVEFTDGHNTGRQSLLEVYTKSECSDGAQPKFESVVAAGDVVCTVERLSKPEEDNYKEHVTCANRGICDQSTGLCNCFDGFFGDACDNVNTYI